MKQKPKKKKNTTPKTLCVAVWSIYLVGEPNGYDECDFMHCLTVFFHPCVNVLGVGECFFFFFFVVVISNMKLCESQYNNNNVTWTTMTHRSSAYTQTHSPSYGNIQQQQQQLSRSSRSSRIVHKSMQFNRECDRISMEHFYKYFITHWSIFNARQAVACARCGRLKLLCVSELMEICTAYSNLHFNGSANIEWVRDEKRFSM